MVLIRRAAVDDLETILELRLAFIADLREIEPDTFQPGFVATTRAFLTDHASSGRLRSWLAIRDGWPAGLVSVVLADVPPLPEEWRAQEGYVINLYVVPEARRQGVARALMATVFGAAADLDLRRLYLHSTDEGRPLYDELGFAPDARWLALRFDADGQPTTAPLPRTGRS